MKKITVLGGDSRLTTAAEILRGYGYEVDIPAAPCEDDYRSSDVLLLPVPTTRDGETLAAPNIKKKIYLK